MLGFHGNEVVAFRFVEVRRAFNGEVVGFGRAAGKNDFFGVGVNQGCNVASSASQPKLWLLEAGLPKISDR